MSGRYRLFQLAIGGFLGAALYALAMGHGVTVAHAFGHHPDTHADQNYSKQESDAGQVGATTAASPEIARYDRKKPCQNPQTDQQADLCQQWRMAKATEELVTLTERQFWLLVATLVVTVFAAGAAVAAARYAKQAVSVTRDIGMAEARAYIDISHFPPGFNFGPEVASVSLKIANLGQTPATIAAAHFEFVPFESRDDIPESPSYESRHGESIGAYLMPSGHFRHETGDIPFAIKSESWLVWFIGYIDYIDIYGRRFRCGYARSCDFTDILNDAISPLPEQERNNLVFVDRVGWNYDEEWEKAPK